VTRLLVATRNPGKVREIRALLAGTAWEAVALDEAGLPETAEEEALEAFETFAENALAKAMHFARRSGLPALADDSGLVVDALAGEPGVRSRRFARPDAARGEGQDDANNRLLLERLEGTPDDARGARFVCAAALARPDGTARVATGTLEGIVLRRPRGSGGFGYDPVILLPSEGVTVAELASARKNALSHRGRAVRAVLGLAGD
jgi:XTP/dITP diphosphohydrolase